MDSIHTTCPTGSPRTQPDQAQQKADDFDKRYAESLAQAAARPEPTLADMAKASAEIRRV